MSRKKIFWKLYLYFLTIIVALILSGTWYFSRAFENFFSSYTKTMLAEKALLIENEIKTLITSGEMAQIDNLCKDVGKKTSVRLTIILPDGKIIGDSNYDITKMDNHLKRPEVQESLVKGFGSSVRFSQTLKKDIMYFAMPLKSENVLSGFIRTAIPLDLIVQTQNIIRFRFYIAGFLLCIIGAVISIYLSRKISQPIEIIKETAANLAKGNLKHRLFIGDSEELSSLADSMNEMAMQLEEKFSEIQANKNELEAVLSSMQEAVIAFDNNEKILKLNLSAMKLLNVNFSARNKTLQEVIRNSNFERFVKKILTDEKPLEEEIIFRNDENELCLQIHGTIIKDITDKKIGVVAVFNDITRLKKLETVRKDFVANVSHELKTPVTSIKGYVETLLNSPPENPDEYKKFLEIIYKQSDRLNLIIEDLLYLSRIEQDAEKDKIYFEIEDINKIIDTACETIKSKAMEKNISITRTGDEKIPVKINASLMVQAMTNLLDNAVKYSEYNTSVTIETLNNKSEIQISVIDNGMGISGEHLPRLFERFYRIDKSRSRKMGGTGLGLAIVKHIVEAHGGKVLVESCIGKGSRFTICIPLIKE
ncbi:MAG: hypothetical protein ACD_79C00301G0002 [uncultured bacterium]|nr:MAG: hypothetical protein ACD_79C00301G0002 [uncultured bacterium]